MAHRWRAMARRWKFNALQCSDSDGDGNDGTTIAIAQRWHIGGERWRSDETAIAMAQRWNNDSEGSDSASNSDGCDINGTPIERWRSDGTAIVKAAIMIAIVKAHRLRDGSAMEPTLRWQLWYQRCDGAAMTSAAMRAMAIANVAMVKRARRLRWGI
ncbi:hypothetical protein CBR_g9180 [Chara braunii]|uniref:Uncharacterized protein n=1 Tax=Chara braunii TaxID=69332 RepID=A0A388KNZ2_CHABU|nr:hypothetical protein CBR_g9180 [Chara braunii]|eukprot:GBG71771.1 hypothetical protein CBR_g9180 [Chara braunii]